MISDARAVPKRSSRANDQTIPALTTQTAHLRAASLVKIRIQRNPGDSPLFPGIVPALAGLFNVAVSM
ncbi:MAG TPA: hypothetical protein VFY29_08090 [Terriglobia bacterium]|nr:hypothetical protein [Terriglobia bacterium]